MAEKKNSSPFEKLMTIQQKLNAPKDKYNSFGKYNYRSCESILQSVKPLLGETKTVLTISDDAVNVGQKNYIKATASLYDAETGELIHTVSALARESEEKKGMDDSQLTGATSSYARKYALNGLFAIDDNKDADATNTHGKNNVSNAADVDEKRIEELELCFHNCKTNDEYQQLWASLTDEERNNKKVYGYALNTAQRIQR